MFRGGQVQNDVCSERRELLPLQWRVWCARAFATEWKNVDVLRANGELVLRTERLVLVPLTPLHEAEHARASGNTANALRDTRSAGPQWREHGFGPWAIRDRRDESFLGGAELHFAGEGIEGIAPDEVEAGWWVTEDRRNEGIATEAMHAAIDDFWSRTDVESVTAYIGGENEPSRRLAARLRFVVRGQGRGRSGEPMTVYELRRPVRSITPKES